MTDDLFKEFDIQILNRMPLKRNVTLKKKTSLTSRDLIKTSLRLEKEVEEINEIRELIDLLKIPPENREEIMIETIIKYFNEKFLLDYFKKEKGKEIEEKLINDCFARYMQIKILKKNEILFRIQDIGDKFYFILNGKIGILIPEKKKKILSQLEYYCCLEKYLIDNENSLLRMTLSSNYEMISFENYENFFDYSKLKFKKFCFESLINIKNDITLLFNFYNENKNKLKLFKFVDNFDEINFITGKNLENIKENIIDENMNSEEDSFQAYDKPEIISKEKFINFQKNITVKDNLKISKKSMTSKILLNVNKNKTIKNFLESSDVLPIFGNNEYNINDENKKIDVIKYTQRKGIEVNRLRRTKDELDKIMRDKEIIGKIEREKVLKNFHGKILEISKNNVLCKFELSEEENKLEKKYSFMEDDKIKKEFNIFQYFQVSQLINKQYFGDLALDSIKQKRTATTIGNDDSILGWIPREIYNKYILFQKQEILTTESLFLHNLPIFKPITLSFFKQKFFKMFAFEDLPKHEVILQPGVKLTKIFFVRTGSIDVSLNASVLDLINLLKNFLKKLREMKYIDNGDYLRLIDEYQLNLNTKNVDGEQQEKYLMKKHLTMFSLHAGEIGGLEAMLLDMNAPYKFTVSSELAKMVSIETTNLNYIFFKIKESRENYVNLTLNKINALIYRINNLKNSFITISSNKLGSTHSLKQINIKQNNNESKKNKNNDTVNDSNLFTKNHFNNNLMNVVNLDKHSNISSLITKTQFYQLANTIQAEKQPNKMIKDQKDEDLNNRFKYKNKFYHYIDSTDSDKENQTDSDVETKLNKTEYSKKLKPTNMSNQERIKDEESEINNPENLKQNESEKKEKTSNNMKYQGKLKRRNKDEKNENSKRNQEIKIIDQDQKSSKKPYNFEDIFEKKEKIIFDNFSNEIQPKKETLLSIKYNDHTENLKKLGNEILLKVKENYKKSNNISEDSFSNKSDSCSINNSIKKSNRKTSEIKNKISSTNKSVNNLKSVINDDKTHKINLFKSSMFLPRINDSPQIQNESFEKKNNYNFNSIFELKVISKQNKLTNEFSNFNNDDSFKSLNKSKNELNSNCSNYSEHIKEYYSKSNVNNINISPLNKKNIVLRRGECLDKKQMNIIENPINKNRINFNKSNNFSQEKHKASKSIENCNYLSYIDFSNQPVSIKQHSSDIKFKTLKIGANLNLNKNRRIIFPTILPMENDKNLKNSKKFNVLDFNQNIEIENATKSHRDQTIIENIKELRNRLKTNNPKKLLSSINMKV